MSVEPVAEFLQALPLFAGLPDSDLTFISEDSRTRSYQSRQYLFHQEDDADRLFVITKGWVKVHCVNTDGEETVVDLLTKGECLGERTILPRNRTHHISAQTLGQVSTIEIPGVMLQERLNAHPEILKRLVLEIMEKVDRLRVDREHIAHMDPCRRIGCLLLRLSADRQGYGGTFTLPFEKSVAAEQLGMKRETFSRALVPLRKVGVSFTRREVTIERFDDLSKYCCTHCSLDRHACAARRS